MYQQEAEHGKEEDQCTFAESYCREEIYGFDMCGRLLIRTITYSRIFSDGPKNYSFFDTILLVCSMDGNYCLINTDILLECKFRTANCLSNLPIYHLPSSNLLFWRSIFI